MIRKSAARILKDPERLLRDCESHLRFLYEALVAYEKEPDRYKQIAAELRVLVCEASQNKPLLLDLLDWHGVIYEVHPIPDLPFPITMVDDISNPKPAPDFTGMSPDQIWDYHRNHSRAVPLREFIDAALAVYIKPRAFSHKELILAVSQQIGSSHEDQAVEPSLLELERILIGGFSGYGAPLREAGRHAVAAGGLLMREVAARGVYEPVFFHSGSL